MGCHPNPSKLITIHLKAAPFNTLVVQAHEPTSIQNNDMVEDLYSQLQESIDKVSMDDIMVTQGGRNAEVGANAGKFGRVICGPFGNTATNDRGLWLLEFATTNNLVLTNTLGVHKVSRRKT